VSLCLITILDQPPQRHLFQQSYSHLTQSQTVYTATLPVKPVVFALKKY